MNDDVGFHTRHLHAMPAVVVLDDVDALLLVHRLPFPRIGVLQRVVAHTRIVAQLALSGTHPLWHNQAMRRTIAFLIAAATLAAQAPAPTSGKRVRRLLIHNATVVDGNGTPASGPKDIVIENNVIADVLPIDAVSLARGGRGAAANADAVIDATGK